jgi:paraquat-inducible protein B
MSQNIPKIEASTKFNFFTSIWLVPFIALLIAGWLAYQYFSELGPQIRIVFPKNEGLQAGQSRIKYRNVPIGTIQKIELQEDGEGIVVVARMDKTVKSFLNDSSKFWIVKPEVGLGGISGLDTLISGTYINMYASKSEESIETFLGQSHAYRDDTQGEYFVLNSPKGNNAVKAGTPIYLKNIKVGQVEYVVLALDNASVDVIVYIENRYTPYLRTDSNFWVRSTFGVSLNNGRVDLAVAPITDLIGGAIEFSSQKKGITCKVPDGHIFKLYANKGEVENTYIGNSQRQMADFKLYSQESAAKLHIGAPVRYEGFEVGKVKEMKIHYDKVNHKIQSEVLVAINLSVFANPNDTMSATGKENFYMAVKEGLRAQIIPSDPITGFLYVDLLFTDAEDNKTIEYRHAFNVLPTVEYQSGNILASMTKILDKINALPLEKLLDSLNTVIEDADGLVKNTDKLVNNTDGLVQGVDKPLTLLLSDLKTTVSNLNKMTSKKTFNTMPSEIDKSLKALTSTLKTTKKVMRGYGSNSVITRQLSDTLRIVTKTSKEMQLFLKMLNRKPNSLIFGDK